MSISVGWDETNESLQRSSSSSIGAPSDHVENRTGNDVQKLREHVPVTGPPFRIEIQ